MIHADKRMNPIHFGSDPANIRIRINPEIRNWIWDQILALAEFALSGCCCCQITRELAIDMLAYCHAIAMKQLQRDNNSTALPYNNFSARCGPEDKPHSATVLRTAGL